MNQPRSFRHIPKQARGHRKVEHILETAEKLFTERGFESVTTNEIAENAQVSIGSLYQFFASKEAILEAVATRYLVQANRTLGRAYDDTRDMELSDAIQTILKLALKLESRRPVFLRFLSITRPQALAQIMGELEQAMVSNTIIILKRYGEALDARSLKTRAQIMVSATGSMLPHALMTKGKQRQQILDEITYMLVQYVEHRKTPK